MDDLYADGAIVDELAWVKPASSSASRLGLDDIRAPRPEQFAGQSAPARISRPGWPDAALPGGG